jgi:hypothetical protein
LLEIDLIRSSISQRGMQPLPVVKQQIPCIILFKRVAQKFPGHPIQSLRVEKGTITSLIVQLTEKGAIGDTSNFPESGFSPIHHDPSSPDPTPENHDNHRGMSNTHKYQGRSSSHKDSGNKLVEALQLPGER